MAFSRLHPECEISPRIPNTDSETARSPSSRRTSPPATRGHGGPLGARWRKERSAKYLSSSSCSLVRREELGGECMSSDPPVALNPPRSAQPAGTPPQPCSSPCAATCAAPAGRAPRDRPAPPAPTSTVL